jgi:hypothetical protein
MPHSQRSPKNMKSIDVRQLMETLEPRFMLSKIDSYIVNLNMDHANQVSGGGDTLYRVNLRANQRYLFMADSVDQISLLNANRKKVLNSSDEYFYFTPHSRGIRYLRVDAIAQRQRNYQLVAKPIHDDFPNSDGKAPDLEPGQVIQGNIDDPEDYDVLSFKGVAGERWAFDVTSKQGVDVAVADKHGAYLKCADGCQPFPYTGRYYVELSDSTIEPYTLSARRVVDDNPGPVPNVPVVKFGTDIKGSLDFWSDEDFFGFDAKAGTTYAFVANGGPYLKPELMMADSSGAVMVDSTGVATEAVSGYVSRRSDSVRLEWVAPADGKYYLRMTGVPGEDYTISSAVQETHDASAAGVATPLTIGKVIDSAIDAAGGSQYFSFSARKNATYRFLGDAANTNGLVIGRIGPDGRSLIERDTPGVRPWTAPQDGTYYLWVRAYDPSGKTPFRIGLSEELDDFGNSAAEAAAIVAGVTVQGLPQYWGDEDWFKMNVTEGEKYTFTFDFGTSQRIQPFYLGHRRSKTYLTFTLVDGDGAELMNGNTYIDHHGSFEWTAAKSGEVFLRVTPANLGYPYAVLVSKR